MHATNNNNAGDDSEERHDNKYAGYYFSNVPYTSEDQLAGRKSDKELRSLISSKLLNIPQVDTRKIIVNVVDQVVSLTGSVETYEQRRRIGEEIWKIDGVVKVLNELHVTEPTTAGPVHRD